MVRSQKELASFLSSLDVFVHPKRSLEQYPSDGDIAAQLLWRAYMKGDVTGKTIIDAGCGTGILGIGALLLGAKEVIFIDIDPDVRSLVHKNIARLSKEWEFSQPLNWSFYSGSVSDFTQQEFAPLPAQCTVIMNPPFGTQQRHVDKLFLTFAQRYAHSIYTMHKTSTERFVEAFCNDNDLSIIFRERVLFPIKQTFAQQRRRIHRIEVTLFALQKKDR